MGLKSEARIVSYMDLDVWRISHELVIEIYRISANFPDHERYGLMSQVRRAAFSIPANIAEGNGRQHTREYIQLLYISKGSLNELRYFLLLAKDLEYIEFSSYSEVEEYLERISIMLMKLIDSLKYKLNSSSTAIENL